jgi:hypothetical protein
VLELPCDQSSAGGGENFLARVGHRLTQRLKQSIRAFLRAQLLLVARLHRLRRPPQIQMQAPRQSQAPTRTTRGRLLPVPNSFTEAQAKSRIEKAGYSNVSGLSKDKDGIWKGKASKGATSVDVGVDYQGNVVSK